MSKTLVSTTLLAPSSPLSIGVDSTFNFTCTPGFTGGGPVNAYALRFEVNDGGGWVPVASSGTGLTTTDTNPVLGLTTEGNTTIVLRATDAGSYDIRIAGDDVSGSGTYDILSGTQSVTVTSGDQVTENDSSQSQASDTSSLTQHHTLSEDDSAQSQTSDQASLTQHHTIGLVDSSQSQASDQATATGHEPSTSLTLNDSSQSQASDTITVSKRELLAWWKLDQSGSDTTVPDSSGNGHTGTLTATGGSWVTGLDGNARRFNPAQERITVPAFECNTQKVALSWVMYIDSADTQTNTPRIAQSAAYTATPTNGWSVEVKGTGTNITLVNWSSGTPAIAAEAVFKKDQYVHGIAIFDGDNVTLYYDLEEVASGSGARGVGGSLTFTIGCGDFNTLRGVIDDVRLYNYAPNAAERLAIYQEYSWPVTLVDSSQSQTSDQVTVTPQLQLVDSSQAQASDTVCTINDGLHLQWEFNDTGSVATDETCNGYDGTLYNLDTGACWVDGLIGGAIQTDADGLVYAQETFIPGGDFTVLGFINIPHDSTNDDIRVAIRWGSAGDHGVGFNYDHTGSTYQHAWQIRLVSEAFFPIQYTTSLLADTWYMVALTWDGTDLRAWLNGNNNEATIQQTPYFESSGFCIGATSDSGSGLLIGTYESARLYNRALSGTELQAIWDEYMSRSVTVTDSSQAQTSDQVTVTPNAYSLTLVDSSQSQSSDQVTLTQHHTLTLNDSSQSQASDQASLTQHHSLTANDSSQAQTSDTVSITQHNTLALVDSSQAQASDQAAITEHASLTLNDSSQAQTSDTLTVTQHNAVTLNDSSQAQASDQASISTALDLTLNDSAQAQTSDTLTVTQHNALTINDSSQAQASDTLTVTQHNASALNDSAQAQTSDTVTVTQHNAVTLTDSSQSQASDTATLTQHHNLAANDSAQTQTSDTLTVTQHNSTTLNDSSQAQTSDAVTVVQSGTLLANDSSQAQTSDTLTVTQHNAIVENDSSQAQSSDQASVTQHHAATLSDSAQSQVSDTTTLIQHNVATLNDSSQAQTSDSIVVVQSGTLLANDSSQAQASDQASVTQHNAATLNDSAQAQTSDNITVVQQGALSANDSAQSQTSDALTVTQHNSTTLNDSSQAQVSDTLVASFVALLNIADSQQIQYSDQTTLTVYGGVTLNDSAQNQTSDLMQLVIASAQPCPVASRYTAYVDDEYITAAINDEYIISQI